MQDIEIDILVSSMIPLHEMTEDCGDGGTASPLSHLLDQLSQREEAPYDTQSHK